MSCLCNRHLAFLKLCIQFSGTENVVFIIFVDLTVLALENGKNRPFKVTLGEVSVFLILEHRPGRLRLSHIHAVGNCPFK